ncbi:flagellin hook IN motif family protein, partial [Vibrio cholerae HC-50A2]
FSSRRRHTRSYW